MEQWQKDPMDDTSSTSTAFVVAADGITSLYDGLTIIVKNTKIASASGCTLNLNNLGAKRIRLSQGNAYCTTHWGLNSENIFIYDATNSWWSFQQGYDSNTNTQVRAYRQTYVQDYPILASRTIGSSIGTPGTESSQTAIYAMVPDDATKQPTINPSTGELKAKIIDATSVNGHTVGTDVPSNAKFTDHEYTGTGLISVNSSTGVISTTATANTGTITSVKTTAGAHTAINVTSGAAEFNVPTKTSHLTNDSGFVTTDTNNRRAFYGTCSTAAATAAKVVTLSNTDGWELVEGTIVGIKFSNSNTAENVTLNINGTGAKSIYYNNNVYAGTSNAVCGYANRVSYYMYNGTYWVFLSNGIVDSNTDTKVRQTLATGNTNRPLLMAYSDNTVTTSNVDNVSYRNNSIYANPSTGTVTATNFAGKINNHTVNKDVPSDAVFTDTNNAVTQTVDDSTDDSNYEVLFSGTADNTTRTEGAKKSSNLKFNPSTGVLMATDIYDTTTASHLYQAGQKLNTNSAFGYPILMSYYNIYNTTDTNYEMSYRNNNVYIVPARDEIHAQHLHGQLDMWQENWDTNDNQKRIYIWGARNGDKHEIRTIYQVQYNLTGIKLNTAWGNSYYHSARLSMSIPTCEEVMGLNMSCCCKNKFINVAIDEVLASSAKIYFYLWGPKQETTAMTVTVFMSCIIRYATAYTPSS